jgi:hypothetical protein
MFYVAVGRAQDSWEWLGSLRKAIRIAVYQRPQKQDTGGVLLFLFGRTRGGREPRNPPRQVS